MHEKRTPICDYEGSDYQQQFWERGEREYEDRVEAVALRRLLPSGGMRMLEVGAGAGRNTLRYEGFQQIVLLDYSRTQLVQARERLGASERYRYVAADVYRLPFASGIFDAATMIRTLHHMANPLAALQQVRKALNSEAAFVLEFANKRNSKAIARWLLRRQTWNPFTLDPVEFAPLNFDFHPVAVRTWLVEAGFAVERQLTVSHFRVEWLKKNVPLNLLVALDSLLQWTGAWFQLSPSVFIKAFASGASQVAPPDAFWRCPACGSLDLHESEQALRCAGCDRIWPVREGVIDFREPA